MFAHPPNDPDPYEEACRLLTLVSQGVVLEAIAPLDEPEAGNSEPSVVPALPAAPAAFAEAS